MHRRQTEQGVIDVIARQDHHRPLGGQAAIEQTLADGAHQGESLGIGHTPPISGSVALGEEDAIRGDECPMLQPLGDRAWEAAERIGAIDDDAAIGAIGKARRVSAEADWSGFH